MIFTICTEIVIPKIVQCPLNKAAQEVTMFALVTLILSGVIYGHGGDGAGSNSPDDELILADGVSPSTFPGLSLITYNNNHCTTTAHPFSVIAPASVPDTSRRNSSDDTLILLEHPT